VIQTGKLDQRIEIMRAVVTGQDEIGEDIFGPPESVRTIWANKEDLSGRELDAALQRWAEAMYKITIRSQPGMAIYATDYILWRGFTLDILNVKGQNSRDQFWIITAKDHEEAASA